MQVTCFAFDWTEVLKRPNVQHVVDEMICHDDIDIYSRELPDGVWLSDSAFQHFSVAEALADLLPRVDATTRLAVEPLSQLISSGAATDELGISPLTDGCYFISLSPERVSTLRRAVDSLDFAALAALHAQTRSPSLAKSLPDIDNDFVAYLEQWRGALRFADDHHYGLIGHCG
jgi:hypothetical protein